MALVRVVLDTNVLYAGLYSSQGASFRVLRAIEECRLLPMLSTTLLFEYEDLLMRSQKALRLSVRAIQDVLDGLCSRSEHQKIFFLWRPQLPDPKDDHVLELSVASGGAMIVTHNVKDFRAARAFGIRIFTPSEIMGDLK